MTVGVKDVTDANSRAYSSTEMVIELSHVAMTIKNPNLDKCKQNPCLQMISLGSNLNHNDHL